MLGRQNGDTRSFAACSFPFLCTLLNPCMYCRYSFTVLLSSARSTVTAPSSHERMYTQSLSLFNLSLWTKFTLQYFLSQFWLPGKLAARLALVSSFKPNLPILVYTCLHSWSNSIIECTSVVTSWMDEVLNYFPCGWHVVCVSCWGKRFYCVNVVIVLRLLRACRPLFLTNTCPLDVCIVLFLYCLAVLLFLLTVSN